MRNTQAGAATGLELLRNSMALDPEQVKHWLTRKVRAGKAGNALGMVLSVFGGLFILYVSFWVTYGVIWFLSRSFYHLAHRVILLIASGFMTLVIVVGARQNWEDLDPLGRQARLARDMDITLTPYNRYGMSYKTNAMTAGAFEVRSLASVINFILCGGVKLVLGAVVRFRQWRRLGAVDVEGCARVIALLYTVPRRQSYEEIVQHLPGLNPVSAFENLRSIDGILFLSTEPAGLALHPELRSELNGLAAKG
ncbi:MAG TPA: hypothetical protein VG167_03380 [Verrucomicrobiae bacterium]|nr:hypothetical protein [Verrucomicrobiae bacterium]